MKTAAVIPAVLTVLLTVSIACGESASRPAPGPAEPTRDQRGDGGHAGSAPEHETRISVRQAAVLGVVEGLTEYLPVSSTGHLILANHYMGLTEFSGERGPFGPTLRESEAVGAFDIVIQLGAILAVLGLYRRRVGQMAMGVVGRNRQGLRLFGLLVVAFLPAAVLGVLFRKPIKEHLFSPIPVAWALAVGGALMIAAELFWKRRWSGRERLSDVSRLRFWQALVIGLAQCLAMWPGTSRSMITIVAAVMLGMEVVAAAEFSFLLALPTLGGATVYEAAASGPELIGAAGPLGLLVGLAVSCVVAGLAVKALVAWLTRHGMWPFGLYRIGLAAAVWLYFLNA